MSFLNIQLLSFMEPLSRTMAVRRGRGGGNTNSPDLFGSLAIQWISSLTKTAICGTATMPICHCMKLSGPLYPGQPLLERA